VMRGLELARPHPDRHRAHQRPDPWTTSRTSPSAASSTRATGTRFGGTANLEAFTETRWVTIRADIPPYPLLGRTTPAHRHFTWDVPLVSLQRHQRHIH